MLPDRTFDRYAKLVTTALGDDAITRFKESVSKRVALDVAEEAEAILRDLKATAQKYQARDANYDKSAAATQFNANLQRFDDVIKKCENARSDADGSAATVFIGSIDNAREAAMMFASLANGIVPKIPEAPRGVGR